MRRVSRALIVTTALCAFLQGTVSIFDGGVAAQRQQRRRPATSRPPALLRVDYSKFFHSTKKHQSTCATCHKTPTANWQKVREYPDVTDYPDHNACVSCHRSQFFKGAKPPICSVCHSNVAPRADQRYAFRNPGGRRQFQIEFPHDKHQDVIARMPRRMKPVLAEETPKFIRASFSQIAPQESTYNNCSICHVTRAVLLNLPASVQPDGLLSDEYALKSVPEHHSSCFNCHWKTEEPIASNCGGCHKATTPRPAKLVFPKLISAKFVHHGGGEKRTHVAECTTCHINITKSTTLRGLKPDVPITSCRDCHNREGLRLDVSKELEAIDKNREFVCSYCHLPEVGRLDPPPRHYLIAGRKPAKRNDPR